MKKLIATLGYLAAVLAGALAFSSTPAEAGLSGGNIRHYAPDDGLDGPILIRCDYGNEDTNHELYEGQNSQQHCPGDTDRVKVRAGQELWCKYSITSVTTVWRIPRSDDLGHPLMDATGWYKIDNLWDDGHGCTLRAD